MKSDTQLQLNVLDELKWQPSVDASQVGVTAQDGVITLTGSVPHYAEKLEAERIAKSVLGVKAVVNDLEVHLGGTSDRNDTEITNAALYTLRWHTWIPNDRIKVTVRNGWVTLEGNVDWQYEARCSARSRQPFDWRQGHHQPDQPDDEAPTNGYSAQDRDGLQTQRRD